MGISNVPSAPERQALQSTLLWGSASMAATIILTVVAAMKKDLRWLLIIAWPFACLAVWEFIGYLPKLKRYRVPITGIAIIAIALGLYQLHVSLKPSDTAEPRVQPQAVLAPPVVPIPKARPTHHIKPEPTTTPLPKPITAIIQTPMPSPTPEITPVPKPCHGDNLHDCGDQELIEWGKPLRAQINRISDRYGIEIKTASRLKGNKFVQAMDVADKNAIDDYRDCCAADALKYYQEATFRLGGGNSTQSVSEWTQKLMQPINSSAWKEARAGSASIIWIV